MHTRVEAGGIFGADDSQELGNGRDHGIFRKKADQRTP